jgi:hypothetical protein
LGQRMGSRLSVRDLVTEPGRFLEACDTSDEQLSWLGIPVGRASHPVYTRFPGDLQRVSPRRIDFHNTTKRGVFALKRQWVTIIS